MAEIELQREVFFEQLAGTYLADLDVYGLKVLSDTCDLRYARQRNKERGSVGEMFGQLLNLGRDDDLLSRSWYAYDGHPVTIEAEYDDDGSYVSWELVLQFNGQRPACNGPDSWYFPVLEVGQILPGLEKDSTMEQVADYIEERVLPLVNQSATQIHEAAQKYIWEPERCGELITSLRQSSSFDRDGDYTVYLLGDNPGS